MYEGSCRFPLNLNMVLTEMLSYSPRFVNQQEHSSQSGSNNCVVCSIFRTFNLCSSFGFTWIIVLLTVASLCLRPCAGGINCSGYNVSCYHGTCVEVKSPVRVVNRTATIVCLCDDHWSGPVCDVFRCSGRTLWVLFYYTAHSWLLHISELYNNNTTTYKAP